MTAKVKLAEMTIHQLIQELWASGQYVGAQPDKREGNVRTVRLRARKIRREITQRFAEQAAEIVKLHGQGPRSTESLDARLEALAATVINLRNRVNELETTNLRFGEFDDVSDGIL